MVNREPPEARAGLADRYDSAGSRGTAWLNITHTLTHTLLPEPWPPQRLIRRHPHHSGWLGPSLIRAFETWGPAWLSLFRIRNGPPSGNVIIRTNVE